MCQLALLPQPNPPHYRRADALSSRRWVVVREPLREAIDIREYPGVQHGSKDLASDHGIARRLAVAEEMTQERLAARRPRHDSVGKGIAEPKGTFGPQIAYSRLRG